MAPAGRAGVIQMGSKPGDWDDKNYPWNKPGVIRYINDQIAQGNPARAWQIFDLFNENRHKIGQIDPKDTNLDLSTRPITTTVQTPQTFDPASFQPGDLIYGLNAERDRYTIPVTNLAPGLFTTIDDLNAYYLGVLKGQKYGTRQPDIRTDKRAGQHAKQFQDHLERQTKSPVLHPSGTKYDVHTRLRRASKQGIAFTVNQGRKIHFALDWIDLDDVINKNRSGEDNQGTHANQDKERAITGAELRFIYRNRKDPLYQQNVVFYQSGKIVKAPWDEDPGRWAQIPPSRDKSQTTTTTSTSNSFAVTNNNNNIINNNNSVNNSGQLPWQQAPAEVQQAAQTEATKRVQASRNGGFQILNETRNGPYWSQQHGFWRYDLTYQVNHQNGPITVRYCFLLHDDGSIPVYRRREEQNGVILTDDYF